MPADLEAGRRAYDRNDWSEAYEHLQGAQEPEDLDRLAVAAQLVGKDEEAADLLQRAHNGHLKRGEILPAVRSAGNLVMNLMQRGDQAQAGGWLARCRRLLDDGKRDCVEVGYLIVPAALGTLMQGEVERSSAMFQQVLDIAYRFGDPDLQAFGRLGRGSSLIGLGEVAAGLALLDENMVAVTSGEVSPLVAGVVYCALIDSCREIYDLKRAHEWTSALDQWCESQHGMVPFRGNCLVYRSEIKQLHGDWSSAVRRALDEAGVPAARWAVLPAFIEVMVAARDLGAAREAVTELSAVAERIGTPYLRARAKQAEGSVLLAEGAPREAIRSLRSALARWRELDVPYEAARTHALIGQSCDSLGDRDAAALELDAARKILARLGAPTAPTATPGGLSVREVEVIRLLAAGKSNRTIATELFISEKTVARHVSNIFTKLRVSTRAAATAYAYEHGLQARRT